MERYQDEEKFLLRERVVYLLREKGIEDSDARSLLIDWIKEREAHREEGYGSEVRVLIDRTLVFKDAGLLAEANELLECAYLGAHNLSDGDLCAEIDGLIDSL